jgi:hypothetical protein
MKELENIEDQRERNFEIEKLAIEHVKKYGYDIGKCNKKNCNITYMGCLDCAIKNKIKTKEWNDCIDKNISYKYPTSKTPPKQITDEKILKKIEMTSLEKIQNNRLYIVENGNIKTKIVNKP